MSSPRQAIKTVRDFEHFLQSRGFSRKEARTIVARGYRELEHPAGAVIGGAPGSPEGADRPCR